MMAPDTAVRRTVCALDCPDACGILVHLDSSGRGVRLEGDPHHPVTRGFLCGKVAQYLERQYHPDRLLYPMRRTGAKGEGRFERITWDAALDEIAERLQSLAAAHGPETILPYSYAGNMGYLNSSGMDRRFFHRLGASRLERTICSTAGMVGANEALGTRYGTEPEQYVNSKLIIAWGANIHGTNIHLWPFIVEARRRGAKLITIDPVQTKTAALADRHFYINPGSDLALALGLMHVILRDGLEDKDYVSKHVKDLSETRAVIADYPPETVERLTGIPAADIEWLAREYATTRPAVIRANYGLSRSERGGRAMRAIACLPALIGSWREPGGGFTISTTAAFQIDRQALERPDLQKVALGREARLLNMSTLGRVLEETHDPPVTALVVYNSNPAAIVPNSRRVARALSRPDLFTVVLEQFQTDTADWADILLPSTTFLENTDLYFAYGHYYIQYAQPALAAPGECKSNYEVFQLLAARMGFSEPCFRETPDEAIAAILASGHRFLDGITLERMQAEQSVRLNISAPGEPFLAHRDGNFPTPSGQCELGGEALRYTPPVESRLGDAVLRQRYTLEMVSSKNNDSMNSTFGHRASVDEQTSKAWLHPRDAEARRIRNGDLVRLYNDRGSIRLEALVGDRVRPGVVRVPSTRWAKSSPDHESVNSLTTDERLTDIGNGPVFYSCLVEVERCGD